MTPDSTLAVTNTCPKDGVHLWLPGTAARMDHVIPCVWTTGKIQGLGLDLSLTYCWGRADLFVA